MTLKAWILTACSPAWFALHLYIAAEWPYDAAMLTRRFMPPE